MPYLVDGNNVMAQRVGWHKNPSAARRKLLDDLARFAQHARVRMMVVFDGAPEDHFPDGASYRGVRVFYAERGSNADERIKQMVEASRERRTLLVVTSDKALADYVRRCGAQIIRAGDFRRRLGEAEAESQSASRQKSDSSIPAADMDQWMRYFGVGPEDDE